MSNLRITILAIPLVLVACASSPAMRVSDAEGIESVSAIFMTCGSPFALTQDCSNWSGPTKKISIGGQEVKVAGNENGTITVMFGESGTGATQSSNLGYELLKRELVARSFEIIKVTPIESNGIMFGYAIETKKPNYHIWESFAVE